MAKYQNILCRNIAAEILKSHILGLFVPSRAFVTMFLLDIVSEGMEDDSILTSKINCGEPSILQSVSQRLSWWWRTSSVRSLLMVAFYIFKILWTETSQLLVNCFSEYAKVNLSFQDCSITLEPSSNVQFAGLIPASCFRSTLSQSFFHTKIPREESLSSTLQQQYHSRKQDPPLVYAFNPLPCTAWWPFRPQRLTVTEDASED